MDHIDFALEPLRALLQQTGSTLPRLAVALVVLRFLRRLLVALGR